MTSYKILSGKEPADAVLKEAEAKTKKLKRQPHLAIVVVGEYKPSQIYVRKKMETAERIGVKTTAHRLSEEISEKELLELLKKLNEDDTVDGYIVQTPLPKQINSQHIFDKIDPHKDVDGFHPRNMGKVMLNIFDADMFPSATPYGVMRILHHYDAPIDGSNAVVIGRSNIVGKPMAMMLLHHNATVTVCHSKTRDLAKHTKDADIIIAAAGAPGLLKADMVKQGAWIVDVGTTRVTMDGKDKVVGDVDFENVIKKANCSPVPGGVGPMTVAMLISNTVKAAEYHQSK